jgi:hypothetical protein
MKSSNEQHGIFNKLNLHFMSVEFLIEEPDGLLIINTAF